MVQCSMCTIQLCNSPQAPPRMILAATQICFAATQTLLYVTQLCNPLPYMFPAVTFISIFTTFYFLITYWNKPTHLFNHATYESSSIAAETVRFRNLWLVNSDCIITHVCTYSHRLLPANSPQGVCYLVGKSFQLSLYCHPLNVETHKASNQSVPSILLAQAASIKIIHIVQNELNFELWNAMRPLIRCIRNDYTFRNSAPSIQVQCHSATSSKGLAK